MNDVISGRVPVIVEGLAGPIARGQLKLLAIASPSALASRPDLPTVAETVPGFRRIGMVRPGCAAAARRPRSWRK